MLEKLIELEPCPHCGNKAEPYVDGGEEGRKWHYCSINCTVCPCRSASVDGENKEEVIAEASRRWNRRYEGGPKPSEGQTFWGYNGDIGEEENDDELERLAGGVRPLTCPCCGSNAIFLNDHWQEIQCKNNNCVHTAESNEDAGEVDGVLIERWNSRVSKKKEGSDA